MLGCMTRKYESIGSLISENTVDPTDRATFDLGIDVDRPVETGGTINVSGTDLIPQVLDISQVPQTRVVYIRVKGGGPLKLLVTSTDGTDQVIPLTDLYYTNLKGTTKSISALKIVGTGSIEWLAAGDDAVAQAVLPGDNWAGTRFVAIDNELGSDANVGLSDVDLPTAALSPLKTPEEAIRRVSPVGRPGQNVVFVFKGRVGAYVGPDGVSAANLRASFFGYESIIIRSTDTFLNDATDRIRLANEVAIAGPGASSEFTVDAAPTGLKYPVVGGGLPTDRSPFGYRIRFLTGTLAGLVTGIVDNDAVSVSPMTDIGTPGVGDTFLIERPSAKFGELHVNVATIGELSNGDFNIAGIEIQADLRIFGRTMVGRFAFLNVTGTSVTRIVGGDAAAPGRFWGAEDDALINSGVGIRHNSTGFFSLGRIQTANYTESTITGTILVSFFGNGVVQAVHSSFIRGTTLMTFGLFGTPDQNTAGSLGPANVLGNKGSATATPLRLSGGDFTVQDGNMGFYGIQLNDLAQIKIRGTGQRFTFDDLTSLAATAVSAVDMSLASHAQAVSGSQAANTAAGVTNEVLLAGGIAHTWAEIALADFIDVNHNHMLGATGADLRKDEAGSWFDVPEVSSDPTGTPPTGRVRVWYRSDTNQLSVKDSGGTTQRVTLS